MPKYKVLLEWIGRGEYIVDAEDDDEAAEIAVDQMDWLDIEPRGQEPDEVLDVQEIKE